MAPTDSSPSEKINEFELIYSLAINDTIPVQIYKSRNTGVTVCIAAVEGPVVAGYFCLATEAFDDDGLPHTLEHLIFLGSEDYPYKGVLDLTANRCMASGTNAWTQTDHTAYTMFTAGSEGFLSLMPLYLEHILYPTLKDSAFLTEVHHITGKGEDAGVVYCEIQGNENTAEYLVHIELSRAIFPGRCSFKANTGGALKNLRESTNNTKVREYHNQFYRPENLTLIIAGQVKHRDVFKALHPIEQKILSKGSRGTFIKPWQTPVPPFTESVDLDVLYPCDEEDNGIVNVGWRGPHDKDKNKLYDLAGCLLLLKYLTDTSVSPLQKEFVEISEPFASTVSYFLSEYTVSVLVLVFEGIPKEKIQGVKDLLVKVLKDTYENGIDIKRMRTVVHRHILETLSGVEENPHDAVALMYCGYMLYGTDKENLSQRLNQISDLKKLEQEEESYWQNLLKTYLIDAPMALVKGIPSIKKRQESMEKEKERIAKQVSDLGPEGLKKKEEELQNAIAENEVPVPDKLLHAVPIPSTESINFHSIKTYTTDSTEQHSRFDVKKLPLYTYLDNVNTNFIYMHVVMNTSSVKTEYRPYIPLLLKVFMECPIRRNGQLIPYEEIVAELETDTVGTNTQFGLRKGHIYNQAVNIKLQVEMEKYEKGVQWLRELLYQTELTIDRLKIVAAKMINDIAQTKRQSHRVTTALMKGLMYKKDSNFYTASMLRQQKFLSNIMERLKDEKGQEEVISEIESVKKNLTSLENLTLHITTNVDKLLSHVSDLYSPWNDFFPESNDSDKTQPKIPSDSSLVKTLEEISFKGCVTGLGCIESAMLSQCCPGIDDYNSPDLAPLLVCLQYLTQLEGPMWKLIRGQGLSYGYSIHPNPNEGLLYLTFYRSTNVVAAYKEAKSIVEVHISENKWEKLLFESAVSSLIFEIIEKEKTVGNLVLHSLLNDLKNVSHDYNKEMVRRLSATTIEDMQRVAVKYLKPLFQPDTCRTCIVCQPLKIQETIDAFKSMGHDLQLYNTLEESYLSDPL